MHHNNCFLSSRHTLVKTLIARHESSIHKNNKDFRTNIPRSLFDIYAIILFPTYPPTLYLDAGKKKRLIAGYTFHFLHGFHKRLLQIKVIEKGHWETSSSSFRWKNRNNVN